MQRSSALLATVGVFCVVTATAASDLELPVVERELDNGLKILVLQDRSIPNVALQVGWRVGSRNEAPGTTGLAHFFEHMMFSGGARYGGRFDPIMEAHGGANNAYTTNDVTVYQDWFPVAALPLVLDMEADRMRRMVFRPDVVESERGVVASERRLSMEEPSEVLREQLWATAFVAHPYQWPVLGWMVDIQSWRQEDLEEFFRRHYAPNNAVLVVVGAVEPDEVFRLVEEKLGAIPRGPERRPIHTREPEQRGERRVVVEDPQASLAQVMCAWHMVETSHPLFSTYEVIEAILLHGESSRLHRRLVEEERVCLEVSGGWSGYQFDPSLFTVEAVMREGVPAARAEALLEEELARLASEGPTPDELLKTRNGLLASTLRRLRTISGKADLLTDSELFFGGWQQLPRRLERVQAVTAEDVKRVAAATFTRRNRTVATLVIDGEATASPEAAEQAADDLAEEPADEEEGEEGEDEEGADDLELPRPAPGAARVELPPSVDFRLANGVRVFLVADREVPLVTFHARLAGGAAEDPAGQEGAADLLAELLRKGAGERDAAAFQAAVDLVGGRFLTAAGARWITVQADFLARDAGFGLSLLADVLRRPRLDPAEFAHERGLAVDALAAARDEPAEMIGQYFRTFLLAGHPLARPTGGDERSLARLELEHVRAAARRALAPSRLWLAVAGDFEPAEMRRLIEAQLGDWQVETPAAATPARPAARAEPRVLLVDKPDALQTYFRCGDMAFDWSDPDYPARMLANTVLGGRFTSRLNQALRVESGLTYGAGSGFDDELFGAFAIRTYTATPTSREAIELTRDVYARFVQGGISAAELESARSYIKGQYAPDSIETAPQAAGMILALEFAGLPRTLVNELFARLDALELEQVNRVVRERFPRAGLSWVVIGRAEVLRPWIGALGEVTEVPLKAPGFGPGY